MGKQHGGLAKVGKVKKQTPKIDKLDNKKQPRGRAKKRLLYNRRYVNEINTKGRKKGPNAQM